MVQSNWVAAAIGMAGLGIGLRMSHPREQQIRLGHSKGKDEEAQLLRMVESLVLEINPRSVIKRIIEIANQMIQAERLTLLIVDGPRRELLITNSGDAEGMRVPMSRGIAGYVAQTGQKVNTPNAYNDPRFDASMDSKMNFKTGSVLCIPVVGSHGQTVAVLQAINKRDPKNRNRDGRQKRTSAPLPFNQKDERALEYLAAHAGFTLQNALLHQQASRAQRTADAMLRLVKSQNNNVTFAKFVQNVLDALYNLLLAERVTVYLVDPIKKMLWVSCSKDGLQGLRVPFGKGISGWVAEHSCPVSINDAYQDLRFDPAVDRKTGFRTKSVLCYPVIAESLDSSNQNGPIAVIQALNKVDGGYFDREDEKAIEAFCAEFAVGLKRRAVDALLAEYVTCDETTHDGSVDAIMMDSIREIEVSFLEQFTPYSGSGLPEVIGSGIQAVLASSDDESSSQSMSSDVESITNRSKDRRQSAPDITDPASPTSSSSEFVFNTKVTVTSCSPKHRSFRPKLLDTRRSSCSQIATVSSDLKKTWDCPPEKNDSVSDFRWSLGLTFAMKQVDPAKFRQWDFSILGLENMEAVAYSIMALSEMGATRKYGTDSGTLEQFVCAVKDQYEASNSYHNFCHALQVAHCSFMFLNTKDAGTDLHLSNFDSYCLLVAALCHDIGHPGTNNAFEIAAESDRYLVYGNTAVLERHHIQETMKLLRNSRTNIFANLTKDKVALARRRIAAGILSTDMACHFVLMKELQEELGSHAKPSEGCVSLSCSTCKENDKSRQLIFNSLLHTADLSAQAVNPSDAMKWGDLVLSEFEDQAKQEESLSLPITPFMKDLWDKKRRCQVQIGFVQNIVIPLWEVVAEVFPSKDVRQCVENLSKVQELYSSGLQ
jgi:GAF domain-containing protein